MTLNLRDSRRDKTSPDCPLPETNRQGGAAKSGIGFRKPREEPEITEDKVAVGSPQPATARKPREE